MAEQHTQPAVQRRKILFVCLGNICRSPAAEGIFRQMMNKEEVGHLFEVDSAGLHGYHEGELADARMRRASAARGYVLTHRSRPVQKQDFLYFDDIICMDASNMRQLQVMAPAGTEGKLHLMSEFATCTSFSEVPDPYYGGPSGFDHVLDLLEECCAGLLQRLCAAH